MAEAAAGEWRWKGGTLSRLIKRRIDRNARPPLDCRAIVRSRIQQLRECAVVPSVIKRQKYLSLSRARYFYPALFPRGAGTLPAPGATTRQASLRERTLENEFNTFYRAHTVRATCRLRSPSFPRRMRDGGVNVTENVASSMRRRRPRGFDRSTVSRCSPQP